jgi:2-C-methyl-D-erythritol 2,4-cyclodiphosphate synthase
LWWAAVTTAVKSRAIFSQFGAACQSLAHPRLRADVSAWLARQRQPELFDAALSWLKFLCRRGRRFYTRHMVHVGIGYDVHPLVAGRKLILGGVEIPHAKGLDGHSDADALMHAICDAVLGALGEEDIGHFFPNTDARWKGAPSRVFLEEAARQVASRKGRIVNVDASIIAQQPRLYPHIAEMKQRIATALGVSAKQIGVKATTNEKLGFVGREEGIAAMAVASVDLPE